LARELLSQPGDKSRDTADQRGRTMNSILIASLKSGSGAEQAPRTHDDVVEIGLLLPTNRAVALLKLARERHESVGQVLRRLIDRELSQPS
jgi:hypothetical protein